MPDPNTPPRFATDFGQMMLQVYGGLCAARELAEADELVVEVQRAESTVNNVAALIVMGSPEAIDRFQKEYDL